MATHQSLIKSEFLIRSENVPAAIAALRKEVAKWQVHKEKVQELLTIEDDNTFLQEIGYLESYYISISPEGIKNPIANEFYDAERDILNAMAPWIESGSYIEILDDHDDSVYRIVWKQGREGIVVLPQWETPITDELLHETKQAALAIAMQQHGEDHLQPMEVLAEKLRKELQELQEAEEQWDELPDVAYYLSCLIIKLNEELDKRGVTPKQLEQAVKTKYVSMRAKGMKKDILEERQDILDAVTPWGEQFILNIEGGKYSFAHSASLERLRAYGKEKLRNGATSAIITRGEEDSSEYYQEIVEL